VDSSRAAYSRFVVAGYIQEQMTDAVLDRTLKSLMRRQEEADIWRTTGAIFLSEKQKRKYQIQLPGMSWESETDGSEDGPIKYWATPAPNCGHSRARSTTSSVGDWQASVLLSDNGVEETWHRKASMQSFSCISCQINRSPYSVWIDVLYFPR